MRRIKDISRCMEIIRIRVGENGRLRTRLTKGENKIKYEGVEENGCHGRTGCHGRWKFAQGKKKEKGGTLSQMIVTLGLRFIYYDLW